MYKSVLQLIEKERSQNPLYCFWTAKNHIQRNDGKTVFNNQFTETFEEQKDNEILVGKREISKEDHLGLECVDSKQEFVNVNVSDTIEGRKKLRSAEQILESESNEISNKPEIYKPSDTGSGSIVKLNEIVETDETDYFDSEDEYWDTQSSEKKRREDMANYLHPSTNVPKEGRYSIAVERFINHPFLKRSIRNFAVGNSFEVHDVISDGECLFRAIADQFLINGCPGHTETTLRQTAIKHLRTKYLGKDGSHHTSFLSGETSEEYLARMESPGEWGDHISLQALADVFTLKIVVFNVYQDDIRRTEVIAEFSEQIKKRPMTIYLGHLEEFYYLSLRPKHWQLHWPYKALLYRLLACSKDPNTLLKDKLLNMPSRQYIPKSELDEIFEHISELIYRRNEKKTQTAWINYEEIFQPNSGQELQLEETEDSLQLLIEDPLHTDPISGTPLPHLTFILKHLLPFQMLHHNFGQHPPPLRTGETLHFLDSFADGSDFELSDVSKSQRMRAFYNMQRRGKVAKVVVLKSNIPVLSAEAPPLPYALHLDTSNTRAGYCRLKFPAERAVLVGEKTCKIESNTYLQAYSIKKSNSNFPNLGINAEVKYIGLMCPTFLVALEWLHLRRKFDFPSRDLLILFHNIPCILIPKAHRNSENPTIEWKINFSKIELLLFNSLTDSQRHGFAVIKVLLDNITFHVEKRLKTKHIKSIFFQACEEIPSHIWDLNFSGCILFVLSKLVICLKHRFLPHYFIPQSNLIECFSAEDIDNICVYVESIRAFPAHIAQFVAEKHGFTFGPNLVKSLLKDIPCFVQTRDVATVVEHTMIPYTYRAARFLAKMGFYVPTCELLKEMYLDAQLIPEYRLQKNMPSLQDFFRNALHKMKQRSSRIILAKLYDGRFGTNLTDLYLKENDLSLAKILPWVVDFRINWLKVPQDKSGDLPSIADFLYKYSLKEFNKRNKLLSTCTIEVAIRCMRHTLQEDSIDMKEIDDEDLKKEILSQKRELKARLKQYYVHVFNISRLDLKFSPLIEHMPDIEKLCEEFPNMALLLSRMYKYLKMDDKSREYASKQLASYASSTR